MALSPSRWSSSWSRFARISTRVCPHSPAVSGRRYFPGCCRPLPSVILPSIRSSFPPASSEVCGQGGFHHTGHLFPKDNTTRVGVCLLVLLSKINTAIPTSRSLQGQEKAEAACLGWCLVTTVGVSGGFLLVGARVAVNKLWVFSPPISTFSPLALSSGGCQGEAPAAAGDEMFFSRRYSVPHILLRGCPAPPGPPLTRETLWALCPLRSIVKSGGI